MKMKYEFTQQELEDLWSGLTCYLDEIKARKDSPQSEKDIKKLVKKVRKYLGHKIK